MIETLLLVVCVSMAILIVRALIGPTAYDRILAANTFGGQTVALIALLGMLLDAMMLLDIALIYALVNFIATIGFLKWFTHRSFGDEKS